LVWLIVRSEKAILAGLLPIAKALLHIIEREIQCSGYPRLLAWTKVPLLELRSEPQQCLLSQGS